MNKKSDSTWLSCASISILGYWPVLFLLALLLFSGISQSSSWQIRPTLNIRETYSDNIGLDSSGNERSAFVTEINPGVRFTKRGGRIQQNISYQMQNIVNDQGNGGVETDHQLQSASTWEIWDNSVFVDERSSISQQNLNSTGNIASDNISGGSTTTVSTFSLSPYWRPRFNGYVNGELRASYDQVTTDGSNLSDSKSHAQSISLQNGTRLANFGWALNFSNREQNRSGNNASAANVSFRNYSARVSYAWTRKYSVFATFGGSDNSFNSTTGASNNGTFYTLGGRWTPSRRLNFSANAGRNFKSFTINVIPSQRTSMTLSLQDNNVGLNTGATWDFALSHRTPRTNWVASYSESTLTVQDALLLLRDGFVGFVAVDNNSFAAVSNRPPGQLINSGLFSDGGLFNGLSPEQINFVDAAPDQINLITGIAIPDLSDQVIINKRAQIAFNGRTGKSVFSVTGFNDKREFQETGQSENVYGISTSWRWNFTRRSSSIFRFSWRNTSQDSTGNNEDRLETLLRLDRRISDYFRISKGINGFVEYRFIDQSSNQAVGDFKENRFVAGINIIF